MRLFLPRFANFATFLLFCFCDNVENSLLIIYFKPQIGLPATMVHIQGIPHPSV